jgi:hypothetical protein
LGVDVLVFGVVSEVASEKDKVWRLRQSVNEFDRMLEGFRA